MVSSITITNMKNKFFSLLLVVMAGCSKDNGPIGSTVLSGPDPDPPPYGLSFTVDTLSHLFTLDRVSLNIVTYRNFDFYSMKQRPEAHTINFTANDSTGSFSMQLFMVDLIPGDYLLDWREHYYYYTDFVFTQYLRYIKEPYYGKVVYTDSSGTYSGAPWVTFTKLADWRITGQFSGVMTNSVTHVQKYITGDFSK